MEYYNFPGIFLKIITSNQHSFERIPKGWSFLNSEKAKADI